MLVPIIFTFDTLSDGLSQTWFFYKAVTYAKRKKWPVIAKEDYFLEYEKQKKIFPNFFDEKNADIMGYDIPTEQELKKVYQIAIHKEMENRRISEAGSSSDAYVKSFVEGWEDVENYICDAICEYEKNGEFVDGFICLAHLKFVQNVADRLGKKVFYLEWSPFRYSIYRNAAYFDEGMSYLHYYDRYVKFEQMRTSDIPILSRKEIMAMFLDHDYLYYLEKNFKEDIYEIGIAGTYNNIVETRAYTNYDMLEELNHCRKKFTEKSIATRYHPGDPLKAKINAICEQDGALLDFIFKCKRVVSINSNVEFEAMLCGKPAYDESGYTRYVGFINQSIAKLEDKVISDEAISFLAFTIFVPYELVDCDEYIKFRLSNPSDIELYMYHLDYYMKCLGLNKTLFDLDREEWYEKIVSARKKIEIHTDNSSNSSEIMLHSKIVHLEQELIVLKEENNSLNNNLDSLKDKLEEAEILNCELQSEIDSINNSNSMKITRPLRKIRSIFK